MRLNPFIIHNVDWVAFDALCGILNIADRWMSFLLFFAFILVALALIHSTQAIARHETSNQEKLKLQIEQPQPKSRLKSYLLGVWKARTLIAVIFLFLNISHFLSNFVLLSSITHRGIASNDNGTLIVFQVAKPPPSPLPSQGGSDSCTFLLMSHPFAFSYGQPFIGNYTPPRCSSSFNSVTMNLTVTSRGRQFDRLGLMYLGDVEVFRTSTAEPTTNGIVWTYTKDMTPYLSLWKKPQKLIFDLGNLVDDTYTGIFNTTLTATFFTKADASAAADIILPISAGMAAQNSGSAFVIPFDNATVQRIMPAGVGKATVSISACGQATEEFWYSNVLSSDTETFVNTTGQLYGYSPFREVQLLIDDMLAGVVWPFPIIFTGGIAPGFWRPIVGIDAFDLREPEIDITPFLPLLSDGAPHTFQIKVFGLADDGHGNATLTEGVGSNWVVTGKILVFLDVEETPNAWQKNTLPPNVLAPAPTIFVGSSTGIDCNNGTNETLWYNVSVSRSLAIDSSAGIWIQTLYYSNMGNLTSQGLSQLNVQSTIGQSNSINLANRSLRTNTDYSYPLTVNTTFGVFPDNSGIFIDATLDRGLQIFSTGRDDSSLFTLASGRSSLDTCQYGDAHYSSQKNASYSFGETSQIYRESSGGQGFVRHVMAANGSVVEGSTMTGANSSAAGMTASYQGNPAPVPSQRLGHFGWGGKDDGDDLVTNVRAIIGRGPGRPRGPI